MTSTTVHLIAAARPNFMKVAPVYHALKGTDWCDPVIIHTGQHYDANMSDAFFDDLGMPKPDIHLGVGSGTHAEQTAGVMVAYERILMERPPAMTVVVGDVNSTMACAIAAKKLCLPVAHLEAGLRSRDWTMPEEINRMVTDAIADVLWTPSPDADENLLNEGVSPDRISHVGNVMIDSYELLRPRIEKEETYRAFGIEPKAYGAVTLHRPSNVDERETLSLLVTTLADVARGLPLVFPLHPRRRKGLEQFGLMDTLVSAPGMHLTEPMSYIRFMGLVREARIVITDSGGIQEETTYLGIPCLTLRDTTERPITVSQGTNQLAEPEDLGRLVARVLAADWPESRCPALWDGRTAGRVVADLAKRLHVS
jgi:UDP-N-acetylglucosamine 2-epimerase (non-hydrolysing)